MSNIGTEGHRRARFADTNNYQQGRSGSKSPSLPGPAKRVKNNATKGGGINRATKGHGGGAMQD